MIDLENFKKKKKTTLDLPKEMNTKTYLSLLLSLSYTILFKT